MATTWKSRIITRAAARRLTILFALLAIAATCSWWSMIRMPGRSYTGTLPSLSDTERELADSLRRDVEHLAVTIGPRHVMRQRALEEAASWLEQEFAAIGLPVERETYEVEGVQCSNIVATLAGSDRAEEIIVVGGHYDSCIENSTPGANDNASGVAATLALARDRAHRGSRRTFRFVAFVNEEPPHFWTENMGSLVHARASRARGDDIVAMLSMETIGCYLDEPGTQRYPPPIGWVYPSTGNFIAFVGNYGSRALVREVVGTFRDGTSFPSEAGALPGALPGVGWSDHWAFWQVGYPALMVTDTAPYRYVHYHQATDTPERLDYERMARVVVGVGRVLDVLDGR